MSEIDHRMDWPPRVSALGYAEGYTRRGSTGQLWIVKSRAWVRLVPRTGPVDYLAKLREQFISQSGWDKMGRPRPTDEWADEQINAMSNVELLQQIHWISEEEMK